MKRVSTFTLAVALAAGIAPSALVAPAYAQEAAAEEFNAGNISDAVRGPVGAAQTALQGEGAVDIAATQAQLQAARGAIANDDDRFIVGQMMLQLGVKMDEANAAAADVQAMQRDGLTLALASNRLAPAQQATYWTFLGNMANQAEDYPAAIEAYNNAVRLNPGNADAQIQLASANFRSGNLEAGYTAADAAISSQTDAGQAVPRSWASLPLRYALEGRNMERVLSYSELLLQADSSTESWGDVLRSYQAVGQLDDQANLDALRLMRATGSLNPSGYTEYYRLAAQRGLPGEAQAVYNEGLSNGMAADAAELAEIEADVSGDRSSLGESRSGAQSAANGRIALNTADAYASYGEYDTALELYRLAAEKGGVDAGTVNLRMAAALVAANRSGEARTALDAVTGTRAGMARFWKVWLDQQSAPSSPAPAAEPTAE